ncbi:hypothetical protein SpCBS45565_g05183 [Spizellomyces sp. 'palustris']|nr:hypothetical protein SpCBS45565_g05183 [Spizellomyces sp. 'palustris']
MAPSPAVEALVKRLLAPRQVLKSGSLPDVTYFGDNPVVPEDTSAKLFRVVGRADYLEGNHAADGAPLRNALLSVLNHGEVFDYVLQTHLLHMPQRTTYLPRPMPDVIVGFYNEDPPAEQDSPCTLLTESVMPLRARCGDHDCPPFPFYIQERKSDKGSQFECLNQLLGSLRAVIHAWELVLEPQNIAIVGTTLVGYHLGLYVMGYCEVQGKGLDVAYHVRDYSICNDRDLLCLMSLLDAVREEGVRLFDLLAPTRWQDLQGPDVGDDGPDSDSESDEEGGEDDESDDDQSSKRRHKRPRLHCAGAKDPVVDSTAKVQGWLAQLSQLEGPGVAPGAEDPQ